MYPFLQIDGDTEIVHSEMLPSGEVKVYIEKPDVKDGFHHATCFLPRYRWEDVCGFTDQEMSRFQEVIESTARLIMEFSQRGALTMPRVFRVGPYWVYFWVNENEPLEPGYVHIAKGVPTANGTKVWITRAGKCPLCNNASKIPERVPRNIMCVVEARSAEVVEKWADFFGEATYYC